MTTNNFVCILKYMHRTVSALLLVVLLACCSSDDGGDPAPVNRNDPPSKPLCKAPADKATDVGIFPTYSWEASTDPNFDRVNYTVSYSQDQQAWITSPKTDKLFYQFTTALTKQTTYYWYVTAVDVRGAESKGDIRSFTTGNTEVSGPYADGEWVYYGGSENGKIPLVFTGDGFIEEDFIRGGDFDKKIDQGIEAFFSLEPYRSLRDKFKIIKLAAFSRERGISIHDDGAEGYTPKDLTVNTRFKVYYTGNGYNRTEMRMGTSKDDLDAALVSTYDFVLNNVPVISKADLSKTTIIVVANFWLYGGTCWWSSDGNGGGKTISIVPTCEKGHTIPWANNNGVPFSYESTMCHEAGGHGFGRLGDEYLCGDTPTQDQTDGFNYYSGLGFNGNLDLQSSPSSVKWSRFFQADAIAKYPQVGVYSGQFRNRMYMSEKSRFEFSAPGSCMEVMDNPHSAVSREVIMQKIYKAAGQNYTFATFLATDVIPSSVMAPASAARSFPNIHLERVHHSGPQTIELP